MQKGLDDNFTRGRWLKARFKSDPNMIGSPGSIMILHYHEKNRF